VPEDELAYRLRAPYQALYLAAKRAETAASEGGQTDETSASPAHVELRDQVAELLAAVDMSEEDRQTVLSSLSCTCCGGNGLSLAFEIKPANTAKF
jgi:hypothetical protein